MEEPAEDLWDDFGIFEIAPEGSLYSNQAGGYACKNPTERGLPLVSFGPQHKNLETMLTAYFCGPAWGGWCTGNLDEASARVIDAVIGAADESMAQTWRVDRYRLDASMEAWVYVVSKDGRKGVLIWSNSD